jgi:hypothetical protein
MKQLVPLPKEVIIKTQNYINSTYPTITVKQSTKLFSMIVNLWFFIKTEHVHDLVRLESQKKSLKDHPKLHYNFTNIHTKRLLPYMINIAGKVLNYTRLIDALVQLDLIEVNPKYKAKSFSKSYRPHVDIQYDNTQNVQICSKRLLKNYKQKLDLYKDNPFIYRKMIDDMYKTKIDLEALWDHLDQSIGSTYSKNTDATLTHSKAYAMKIQSIKINMGLHFFTVSDTGRVYNSISNLPTIMLPYVKLNGKEVVELDAANSQPLLLSGIISHDVFKKDVESGIFYDRMAESEGITRSEFKKKAFRWIFFNDEPIGPVWKERLDKVYPGLSDKINEIKKGAPLWKLLQTAEANIWIKLAQKQLFPICTRHDSFLVNPSHVGEIKKQLISTYKKMGMKVKIEVSYF